jgi:hypothetical protein
VIPEKSVTDTAVTLQDILKKIRVYDMIYLLTAIGLSPSGSIVFTVIYQKSLRLLIMKKRVSVMNLENMQQIIKKFQRK